MFAKDWKSVLRFSDLLLCGTVVRGGIGLGMFINIVSYNLIFNIAVMLKLD